MRAARPGEVWIHPDGRRYTIMRQQVGQYVAHDETTGTPTLLDMGTLEQAGWHLEQPVLDLGDI